MIDYIILSFIVQFADVNYPVMVFISDWVSAQFLRHKNSLNFSCQTDDEFLSFLLSTVSNLGESYQLILSPRMIPLTLVLKCQSIKLSPLSLTFMPNKIYQLTSYNLCTFVGFSSMQQRHQLSWLPQSSDVTGSFRHSRMELVLGIVYPLTGGWSGICQSKDGSCILKDSNSSILLM